MNKLLLLDGNSVLHRAYYAMPDWRNRSGEAMAGVYGFLSMLLKAIEEIKPSHLVIVFDHPGPTFRNLMYVGYQTNREKDRQLAEDIWGQIEKLRIIFEKVGVPTFQIEGFEADDTVGTIAKGYSVFGIRYSVVIITGDRDLMQLVNDQISLYMPQKGITDGVLVDRNKVKERLGVWPEEVIDYKALVGDSSDNYPGIPGIGPKGAIELINKYGSFEKIISNAPSDPPLKLRGGRNGGVITKLINGYESGELSKRLATIKTDVPVTLNLDDAIVPDEQKIMDVLQELGYKSLMKRVSGKEAPNEDSSRPRLFE